MLPSSRQAANCPAMQMMPGLGHVIAWGMSQTRAACTEENIRSSKFQKDAIRMFCNASVVWLGQDLSPLEHGLACCDL